MIFSNFFVILFYIASVNIFGIFLNFGCILSDFLGSFYSHNDQQIFDYIIVGAGTAGALIANKLSYSGKDKILLLEAGKNAPDFFNIPSIGLLLQGTPFDWNYKTVPQKDACLALQNNISRWPMGKILGGTSMLNNMLYIRGNKADFDEWFTGKKDYDYSEVLQYFKRIENFVDNDKTRNFNKPVIISDISFATSLPEIVLETIYKMGYNIVDNNLNSKIGFDIPKFNIFKGKRWTTASNLKINQHSSLTIKIICLVQKILFKSNFEASGVEYSYFGKKYTALAKKGVIISAGVVGSPKLLMLSGIGPEEHLKSLGIRTIKNLPVGNNLQDHISTGLDLVMLNKTLNLSLKSMFHLSSLFEYYSSGTGPWTTAGCEAVGFLDSTNKSKKASSRPNLEFMVMPLGITEDKGYYLRKLIGISDQVWRNYFAKINAKTVTILPVLLHPKSVGTVRLKSKNPLEKPLIDPKYLSAKEDVEVLIDGVKFIESLIKQQSFRAYGAQINRITFPGCESYNFGSEKYWECYIRQLTVTSYHPVGTCKMGKSEDPSTVVDFNFQVKGLNKLYVVDGSVLPSLPSGNINAPIMFLAEMATDLIKKIDYLASKTCAAITLFIPENMC